MAGTKSQISAEPPAKTLARRSNNALSGGTLDVAPIPAFHVDAGGHLTYANRAFAALLGRPRSGCVGLDLFESVHPEDAALARAGLTGLFEGSGPSPWQADLRLVAGDGAPVWVLATATRLRRGRSPLLCVLAVDIDIRKRAGIALAAMEQRWNIALESAGQGVWDHDARNNTSFVSRTWNQLRGFDRDQPYSTNVDWLDRIHPDDAERIRAEVDSQDQGTLGFKTTEYRERHADGHWMWILSRGRTIEWMPDGKPARIVGTDTDITTLKEAEANVQFANTVLTTAMETSPDAILVVDASSRIASFNTKFSDMWGIPRELMRAGDENLLLEAVSAKMLDRPAFLARVRFLRDHPETRTHDVLETVDGRFIDRFTGALRTADGQYLGRVWFYRDITESRLAQAQILRNARTDALTGLANRRVFMEALQSAAAQPGDRTFAVLYLDLDHFKDINDTLGHPVGDEFLFAVANRLRANTRVSDIVARFGGDEFGILYADVGDPANAEVLARKLIAAIGEPFLVQGNEIRTGASIGISLFGRGGPDPETTLTRADLALYRAKAEGRGSSRFFNEAMEAEVRTRVALGFELHDAIASGQLFLLYQPQVDLATGRIVGIEALVRWRHPTRGILTPSLFIPLAERTGLVAPLGRWVLQEACRQAMAWREKGFDTGPVGVNLSAVQFKRSPDLEREIEAILSATGLPPGMLELELTETVLMTASQEHNDVLRRLREKGMRLAIDDFGTGYSSFDYLRRFPVDRIKIAQVFLDQVVSVPGCAAIVRATLGLAHELGIDTIAEGIETQQQLDLLKAWGCRDGQGHYFAAPLPAERRSWPGAAPRGNGWARVPPPEWTNAIVCSEVRRLGHADSLA